MNVGAVPLGGVAEVAEKLLTYQQHFGHLER